jgi:hypothetical protein
MNLKNKNIIQSLSGATVKEHMSELKNNNQLQEEYIKPELFTPFSSDDEKFSSSSGSEKQSKYKVIFPKKEKKKNNTSKGLLDTVLKQNKDISDLHKKIYKLKNCIEKDEIISRYIKLDLNNVTVQKDTLQLDIKEHKSNYMYSKIENYITRFIIILYIMYNVFLKII